MWEKNIQHSCGQVVSTVLQWFISNFYISVRAIQYSMRTIKIKRNTRDALRVVASDNESVDKVINRLLDDYGDDLRNTTFPVGSTNVDVSADTMDRIKSFKLSEHESYDSILNRLLSVCNSK